MISQEFFRRRADIVAKDLLGKTLVKKTGNIISKFIIVETEAYFNEEDPASRAVHNGDIRKTMLMKPGTILVYGIHNSWLLNFVTGKEGEAEAVLIRALQPLNDDFNTKGPGLLTKNLGINKSFHKKNLFDNKDLWLENENSEDFEIVRSHRIGVSKDLREKYRFYIKNNKFVSK